MLFLFYAPNRNISAQQQITELHYCSSTLFLIGQALSALDNIFCWFGNTVAQCPKSVDCLSMKNVKRWSNFSMRKYFLWFHDAIFQKDFYTLKELERLCHKEKGIPSMTVKDVLMSLVFDGLVDSDKIGTSVYFWAFPSKAGQSVRYYCLILP